MLYISPPLSMTIIQTGLTNPPRSLNVHHEVSFLEQLLEGCNDKAYSYDAPVGENSVSG
jgi:hypothetical protein